MVRIIRLSKKGFCNHPHGGRLWVLKPDSRGNPALTLASIAFLFPNWFSGMDFPEFTPLGSFSQPFVLPSSCLALSSGAAGAVVIARWWAVPTWHFCFDAGYVLGLQGLVFRDKRHKSFEFRVLSFEFRVSS